MVTAPSPRPFRPGVGATSLGHTGSVNDPASSPRLPLGMCPLSYQDPNRGRSQGTSRAGQLPFLTIEYIQTLDTWQHVSGWLVPAIEHGIISPGRFPKQVVLVTGCSPARQRVLFAPTRHSAVEYPALNNTAHPPPRILQAEVFIRRTPK